MKRESKLFCGIAIICYINYAIQLNNIFYKAKKVYIKTGLIFDESNNNKKLFLTLHL